jgi:hypothetical protein
LLDRYEAQLGPWAAQDRSKWGGPNEDLRAGLAGLKKYIEQRRAFLAREIKRLRQA